MKASSIIRMTSASVALILSSSSSAQLAPYKNPKLSIDARVSDLLKRMTVAEKIAQLRSDGNVANVKQALATTGFGFFPVYPYRNDDPAQLANHLNELQKAAQTSRLGIPIMPYEESLHGLIDKGHVSFPQAIALAATWDPDFIHRVAAAIAEEDRANGVRQVLSPVINVCRDARWGRMEESYGEDPLLTSQIAVAFVSELEKVGVVTTPKHYVANLWDGGRDSNSVQISQRQLFDIYLAPFEACFKQGGSRSVMCSYNAVNGVPCADDPWLLTDVLRSQWGFKGYVVSDWGAANNVVDAFHQAASKAEGAALLLNAGMDAEHPGIDMYGKPLEEAVKRGLVSIKTLDQAVGRIIRVKFQLGLFEQPLVDPVRAAGLSNSPAHRELALEAARKCVVLLKNERDVLPLDRSVRRIAVFGDIANAPTPLGGYSGDPGPRKSFLEGLRDESPDTHFDFVPGCKVSGEASLPAIPSNALTTPDGQAGLKAEFWTNEDLSGSPAFTRIDPQVDFDWGDGSPAANFRHDHFSVRWTGYLTAPESGEYSIGATSDDGMRVIVGGKLVIDDWTEHGAKTTVARVSLVKGERVSIKVEYFQRGGEAVAKVGWQAIGSPAGLYRQAREAAAAADLSIVFVGIREGEGQDRAYLKLPGNQEDVILAASEAGKPVVVVLVAGAPVTMEAWGDRVPAILDVWYPGEEGAQAVANVIYGRTNPGGKLPMTFPKSVGQCPLYYNFEPSGRGYGYVDDAGVPLFPFGHGLSYTKFEYSNLKIAPAGNGKFTVSVDVKNVGKRAGEEVVQLYVRQEVSSVLTPIKALKGFQRVPLQWGETETVTFPVGFKELSIWDRQMRRVVEPGKFEVMVGSSSGDIRLRGELTALRKLTG